MTAGISMSTTRKGAVNFATGASLVFERMIKRSARLD